MTRNDTVPIEHLSSLSLMYLEALNRYFGEERVDVHLTQEGLDILTRTGYGDFSRPFVTDAVEFIIRFPEVIVENSQGDHELIKDLFVKIFPRGTYVQATRSSFTRKQITVGYVHSHIPHLFFDPNGRMSETHKWQNWCLGSGPINRTLRTIRDGSRETVREMLPLLCLELDNLTKVESLEGGPYMRIVGMGGAEYDACRSEEYRTWDIKNVDQLIRKVYNYRRGAGVSILPWIFDYFKDPNHLKLRQYNGNITLAEDLLDLCIRITNDFAVHAPESLHQLATNGGLYVQVLSSVGRLKIISSSTNTNYMIYLGTPWLTFKGAQVPLTLVESTETLNGYTVLDPRLYLPFILNFLKYLTVYYYDQF